MHNLSLTHNILFISKIKAKRIENILIVLINSVISFIRLNSLISLGNAKTIFLCMSLRLSRFIKAPLELTNNLKFLIKTLQISV